MKASAFNTEPKYLNVKAAVQMDGKIYTIYAVKGELVDEKDIKPKMVIEFKGVEKTLVVNKTNRDILIAAFGDETDAWVGKNVVLHIVMTQFQGQATQGIQLKAIPA
jgi:hypothetical protein